MTLSKTSSLDGLHKRIADLEQENRNLLRINRYLEETLDQYAQIFHSAPIGYFILDSQKCIKDTNLMGARLLRLEKPQMIEFSFLKFVQTNYHDIFNEYLQRLSEGEENPACEIEMVTAQNNPFQVQLEGVVIKNKGAIEYEIVVIDINLRKELEVKLQNHSEALDKSNQDKDKFLSIISQDLRSLLRNVCQLSQQMVEINEDLDKEGLHKLAVLINTSANKTNNLLENLLQWSRLQQGTMAFEPEELDLYYVCKTVLSHHADISKSKSIELRHSIDPFTTVSSDPHMLNTILHNLVANSIKFTEPGGFVEITTAFSEGFVQVSVSDNGLGIPDEENDKLLKIEVKNSRVGTRGERGHGLGLILVKECVEKNGGTITWENKEGTGTTFTFTVPAIQLESRPR